MHQDVADEVVDAVAAGLGLKRVCYPTHFSVQINELMHVIHLRHFNTSGLLILVF